MLSAGLGFALLMVLTRMLSPTDFGIISPIIAIQELGLAFIDTVLFAGIIIVASKYTQTDVARAESGLRASFWLKFGLTTTFALILFVSSEALSRTLFGHPNWTTQIRLMSLAIVGLSIYTFALQYFLVWERFFAIATFTLLKNGMRLLGIIALLVSGGFTISTVIDIYVYAAWACAICAVIFLPRSILRYQASDRRAAQEIFTINKWMTLTAFATIAGRFDILLLSALSSDQEVGYFSAAFQLCNAVAILSQALVTTLLPRAAKFETAQAIKGHIASVFQKSPYVVALAICLILSSGWFVPLILGTAFSDAVGVFNLLILSSLITLVANPILIVLFPMNLTKVFGIGSIVMVMARVALVFLLVPQFGAVGAATADLISKSVILVLLMLIIARALRRWRPGVSEGKGG